MQNRQLQLGRSLAVIGFSFRREKETEEEEEEEEEGEEGGVRRREVMAGPARSEEGCARDLRGT